MTEEKKIYYSWSNVDGGVSVYESMNEILNKENFSYLANYRDSCDQWMAGFLVEITEENPHEIKGRIIVKTVDGEYLDAGEDTTEIEEEIAQLFYGEILIHCIPADAEQKLEEWFVVEVEIDDDLGDDSEELIGIDDLEEVSMPEFTIEKIKEAILEVNNGKLPSYMEKDHMDYSVKYVGNMLCISSGIFNTNDVEYMKVFPERIIPFMKLIGLKEDDLYYYAKEKPHFFLQIGVSKAQRDGKKIVFYENLS
jgi:hypothetical protein